MKIKMKRGLENKVYTIMLLVICICFITFFTSKFWMYDDHSIMQSPFHTEINGLEQTILRLNKWEYNPRKELMEVSITTKHTGSDLVKPTFSFAAKEKESLIDYPVKVVYADDANIIVHIKKVPKNYRIFGLFVKEKRDQAIVENEMKAILMESSGTLDQDDDEIAYKEPKPKKLVIIGDYRKIKTNKNLKTKEPIDYQKELINREIKQVEKKLSALEEKQMPLQQKLISSIEKEIKALEIDMEYQTEEEKQESMTRITSKKEAIENAKKDQEEHQQDVEKLKEKREKLYGKLESLRPG
ncbi:hypothetical protein [Lederbergia citrea]|uniref:hypothetical protein n=1 Tax=Lederbergia citrea TaxID=2833581 RepID=UPI001BCA5039|nr:hypothetical protein [Lederbergia citrea]MBS4203657.1 hypothetical protein [Lederbergia citrea]